MKKWIKRMIMMVGFILLWMGTGVKPVRAAELSDGTVCLIQNIRVDDPEAETGVGNPQNSGQTYSSGGSGVDELDQAANRTNTLITWVCGWIGGLMALFGIIWAAINQASHNSEGRNQGIIVGAIGIVVAFAPQITNMILGR